jgi:virginiamycin B lyase
MARMVWVPPMDELSNSTTASGAVALLYVESDHLVADRILKYPQTDKVIDARVGHSENLQGVLERAVGALVVVSPEALANRRMRAAYTYALEEGKPLVVILGRKCKLPFELRAAPSISLDGDEELAPFALDQALQAARSHSIGSSARRTHRRLRPNRRLPALFFSHRRAALVLTSILCVAASIVAVLAAQGRIHLMPRTPDAMVEYPILTPQSGPTAVAVASDDTVWFTESLVGKVGHAVSSGSMSEIALADGAAPSTICAGPHDSIWVTIQGGSQGTLGEISNSGTLRTHDFPSPSLTQNVLGGITTGPDGNLWFLEETANAVGHMNPSGEVTTLSLDLPIAGVPSPIFASITVGQDGNLWFADRSHNRIGRVDVHGHVTTFPIPTPASAPAGITSGPDGSLWFTENAANQIGRVSLNGVITEFALPPDRGPASIVSGVDGYLWFTEFQHSALGRLAISGQLAEYTTPTPSSKPVGLAVDYEGNLWFAEYGASQIGELRFR